MNKIFKFGGVKSPLASKWMKASIWMLFIMLAHTQLCLAREYEWTGSKVADVLASSSKLLDEIDGKDEHDFFLYNVGAKKFVFQGGYWGTKPILDANKATRFNVSCDNKSFLVKKEGWLVDEKPELQPVKIYVLTSNVGSNTGRWLGQKTGKKNALDNGFWMDCEDGSWIEANYKQYKNVAWNFQRDMDHSIYGDNTYTIRSLYSTGDNMWEDHRTEHLYLYYDTKKDSVVLRDFHKYCTEKSDSANIDKYAMWRLVTVKEIKEKLKNLKSADIDDPFNCTFFLKDPYLCRYSSENESWNLRLGNKTGNDVMKKVNGSSNCLKLGLSKLYSSEIDGSTEDNRYGTKDASGKEQLTTKEKEEYARVYGKYFCGEVRGIPGSASSDYAAIYQNVTIPMTGWYRVSCQGFVSTDGNTSYLYAQNQNDKSQFRYARLNNISDFEVVGKGHDNVPTTMDEAGYMFYDEQYPNQVYIYMKEGETLQLGIRFRGNNEWTAFDDFGLAYCGYDNIALALVEDMTEMSHITNAATKYDNFNGCLFDLHRTFVPHKWNTFVLPVSLNWRQCQELFGSGTKVAELTNYNNGVMVFNRVEHRKTEESKIVIEANKPYIIKPTLQLEDKQDSWDETAYGEEKLEYESQSSTTRISVNVPRPFVQTLLSKTLNQKADATYMSGTAFDNSNNMMALPGTTKNGLTFHGTLTKTYSENEAKLNLTGKYIVYDGKIYYVNQAYGLLGMRGYFSFDDTSASTDAKAMRFSVDGVEDSSDQITGIESILGNTPFAQAGSKQGNVVYNLSGQVVSTQGSLEGLPKGMYIIKGKKVLVK